MKKICGMSLALLLMSAPALANEKLSRTGFFANPKVVFRPLLADPREIQLGMRLVSPVSKKNLGEIAAGEYFGLYRWALPWPDAYIQWSIAGGVFSRFDLTTREKDNLVNDYYANMPIDFRKGRWSARLLPYHTSSHYGDDYIKRTGRLPEKYSFDGYKTLIAFEPGASWRIYGGHAYIIRNRRDRDGRHGLQGGVEWTSPWYARNHMQWFWASDYQTWQRLGWNPTVHNQAGVRLARDPDDPQKLAIYAGYNTGQHSFGQFYQEKESTWVLGVRLDIL